VIVPLLDEKNRGLARLTVRRSKDRTSSKSRSAKKTARKRSFILLEGMS
jgi:hypothetical protein